jgi:hypothetical protein
MHATDRYYQNKIAKLEKEIGEHLAHIDDLYDHINAIMPLTVCPNCGPAETAWID